MVNEAIDHLIHKRMLKEIIQGILSPRLKGGQLVNGHFAHDSFFIILKEKQSLDNILISCTFFMEP